MKTFKPVNERSKNEIDQYAAKKCKQHQIKLLGGGYCSKKGHQRKLTKDEIEYNYTPQELERLTELQRPVEDKPKSEPAFIEATKEEVVEVEEKLKAAKEEFQVIRIDSDDYKTNEGTDWNAVTREVVAHISKANSRGFDVVANGYTKDDKRQDSTPHHILIEEKE